MKILSILFLLLSVSLFAQTTDTLKNHPSPTPKYIKSDSSVVHQPGIAEKDTSSKKSKVKVDTLQPIYQKPEDNSSDFINRETFDRIPYRYTGDLLKYFDLENMRDFGFIGYPNETFIYGAGNNGVSYLEDGILQNNRVTNSLDLNDIQSEYIDSIEVVPSPRSFLYGPLNNTAAVNFITRDFTSPKPYSRIKYDQGPYGEAMVDALFNEVLFDRLDAAFDITNRKTDGSYANSDFSIWQVNVQLKYFLSNKINILGSYNFIHSQQGINGGVNVDTIAQVTSDINSYLYDPLLAPVNNPDRRETDKWHYFNLRMLGRFDQNSHTDLNFYYKFSSQEIDDDLSNVSKASDEGKIYGANLKENYSYDIINLNFNGNYEHEELIADSLIYGTPNNNKWNRNLLSASAVFSINLLDSAFIPSVYYKYLNDDLTNENYGGIGFDMEYLLNKNIKIYAGHSDYSSPDEVNKIHDDEVGGSLSLPYLFLDAKYFRRQSSGAEMNEGILNPYDIAGAGIKLNFNIWKIGIETLNSYYYDIKNPSQYFFELPKYSFTGGLFYEDILFDSNLNLKTGFRFYYYGKSLYNEYQNNSLVYQGFVPRSGDVDFVLSGVIQKVANVYFTWENLLSNQYYLVPYYPMPQRGIIFGLAWELLN
jgi:TonB-dependent Receptor Plug Domain/Putative porin